MQSHIFNCLKNLFTNIENHHILDCMRLYVLRNDLHIEKSTDLLRLVTLFDAKTLIDYLPYFAYENTALMQLYDHESSLLQQLQQTQNQHNINNISQQYLKCKKEELPYLTRNQTQYNISETFEMWVQKSHYQVVFDSEQDNFDSYTFNSKVVGRSHLAIIIKTTYGNVFGSYTGGVIPEVNNANFWNTLNDDEFFVFTLQNKYNTPPLQFFRHNNNNTIGLIQNDNKVFAVYDGWDVTSTFIGTMNTRMNILFPSLDPTFYDLFTDPFRNTFEIEHLFVIHLD
ncbi:TLDc domain-containing protein [Entamoeba marina]